jgi:hypothetical protein
MSKMDEVDYLVGEEAVPITRVCAHLGLARSSYYKCQANRAKADEPVIEALNQAVTKNGAGSLDCALIG